MEPGVIDCRSDSMLPAPCSPLSQLGWLDSSPCRTLCWQNWQEWFENCDGEPPGLPQRDKSAGSRTM